ncbi:MAG: diaminopimelate decarboxylase [Pseudomonadales bacterium]|nr:diaminopimelate decarboxylase [Pseudomonadales bacterium]
MDYFQYRDHELFAEDVYLGDIAAQYGTPCYVYSRATLERHWHAFDKAFADHDHQICFAVKALSNIAVLNILAKLGSGFDIVSGGELERVLVAGGDPKKVVFSGVGKQRWEIEKALDVGVHCFNVESESELQLLNTIAVEKNTVAPISLRVNPDVDAQTHPYISTGLKENKFGISIETAVDAYKTAAQLPGLHIIGIDCHIGSQLTTVTPFLDALDRVLVKIDELAAAGIDITHIDLGGGLGVRYKDETPPEPAEYASAIAARLKGRDLTILLEPGRAIAANAGVVLTQVQFAKITEDKNFLIVDAAMNDLIRPSLYQAWQEIIPVSDRSSDTDPQTAKTPLLRYDVVGPICETGDYLGKDRELQCRPEDILAIRSSGAYGMVMSSNYNSRNRPAEIMVDGNKTHLIRRRETVQEQIGPESILP